jgi:hypothetical protein
MYIMCPASKYFIWMCDCRLSSVSLLWVIFLTGVFFALP